jgi:hypothetical protein
MPSLLLPLLGVALAAGADQPDPRVTEIIANVEANEKLYRSLDVKWHFDYRLGTPALDMPGLAKWSKITNRCVLQGSFLFVSSTYEYETRDGRTGKNESQYGYDGETVRKFQNQIANVRQGRDAQDPLHLFRPHKLLLPYHVISNFPFSVWLRGGRELQLAYPEIYEDADHLVKYDGEEKMDGLSCIRLRCELWRNKPQRYLSVRRYLWLAPERNYLPIKVDWYAPKFSADKLFMYGKVTAWEEIATGVWLPKRWEVDGHNEKILQEEGRLVHCMFERHWIETAKLDPAYPKSFFQDVQFPKDAIVYEVDAQGKIVKTHKPGEFKPSDSPAKPPPQASSWVFWLLLGLAVLCAAGGVYLVARRRSK